MNKEIDILSLFNGMGCIWIALDKTNIKVGKRYSSEIDKYANKVNDANYPDTIQLGDINNWCDWDIDWKNISLVTAGSPCQGFSFAGKQLAFDDPRSRLFFVFIDILNHVKKLNPDVRFILENVRMKKEHEMVITDLMGINPLIINSALVSAQNRVRLYWTNICLRKYGLYSTLTPGIPQPKDRGILLKDILQSADEIDEKYYLSNVALNRIDRKIYSNPKLNPDKTGVVNNNGELREVDKSSCIDTNYHKGMDNHAQRTMVCVDLKTISGKSKTRRGGISETKCQTLDSNCYNGVIQLNPSKESGGKQPYQHNRVYSANAKMTALDTDSGRKSVLIKVGSLYDNDAQGGRIYSIEGKSTSQNSLSGGVGAKTGLYEMANSLIRRLTPIECCRLQTVSDNYFYDNNGVNIISETQIYKCLGNGWTVDVIVHILNYLKLENLIMNGKLFKSS